MKEHFHPSVMKFAGDLGSSTSIEYSGDPLQDFTNIAFLDKFV
jgi:hypothetical protein